jgi:hypothetical protein
MSFFNRDRDRDRDRDTDSSTPAKYRAMDVTDYEASDARAFATRCASRGCYASPSAVVYPGYWTVDAADTKMPKAYCAGCAGERLSTDTAAREYPLSALADPDESATDAVGPVTVNKVNLDSDGVMFELSCDRKEASADAWVAATNETDSDAGVKSVVSLRDHA